VQINIRRHPIANGDFQYIQGMSAKKLKICLGQKEDIPAEQFPAQLSFPHAWTLLPSGREVHVLPGSGYLYL
jgi:hypothetical protein